MNDDTLRSVQGWADKQRADLAAQASAFAPVGTDIHEDMARIYEIAVGDGIERDVDAVTAKQLDDIASIARGWVED